MKGENVNNNNNNSVKRQIRESRLSRTCGGEEAAYEDQEKKMRK